MAKAESYCEVCEMSFNIVFESPDNDESDDAYELEDIDVLGVEFCPFCGEEIDPSNVIYDE
jgi:CRISPR/Cas system-associated protein Cas10 (large subunit of type III CRISPR-Cas system)